MMTLVSAAGLLMPRHHLPPFLCWLSGRRHADRAGDGAVRKMGQAAGAVGRDAGGRLHPRRPAAVVCNGREGVGQDIRAKDSTPRQPGRAEKRCVAQIEQTKWRLIQKHPAW